MKKRPAKNAKQHSKAAGAANQQPLKQSLLALEKAMGDIQRLLEKREFADIDQVNEFLATMTGSGLNDALRDAEPASAKWEAQELAFNAMEAPTAAKARKLARRALDKDPDCVDALLLLADIDCQTRQDFIAALENAVAAGERSLGKKFFKEAKGDFWGLIETRPYMRARMQLAQSLWEEGREQEAIGHYEGMLELNPNDNQGVRDVLPGCYLAVDNLTGVQRLLRRYKDDISAVFAWGKVLERYLANDLGGARRQLDVAQERNRTVQLYLSGQRKLPRQMPGAYSLYSEEEAIISADLLAQAWARHKEATQWLIEQMNQISVTKQIGQEGEQ